MLAGEGAVWIDLNVGCPVKKFIRNCAGSALLRDLPRAAAIVRAMRAASRERVSVKMRTGWDERSIVAPEFARIAVAEGAELLSVHGRTRAQQYTGRADRGIIRAVVEAVPGTPVLANGDVVTPEDVFDDAARDGRGGRDDRARRDGQSLDLRAGARAGARRARRAAPPPERLATIERHIGPDGRRLRGPRRAGGQPEEVRDRLLEGTARQRRLPPARAARERRRRDGGSRARLLRRPPRRPSRGARPAERARRRARRRRRAGRRWTRRALERRGLPDPRHLGGGFPRPAAREAGGPAPPDPEARAPGARDRARRRLESELAWRSASAAT